MIPLGVSVAIASRSKPGQPECGDLAVAVCREGKWLIVVADGLGHGPEAAIAARAAVDFVVRAERDDLALTLRLCDRAIAHTRGVALAVLHIDAASGELTYAGVGNVEVAASTAEPARLAPVPGVVGGRFRKALVTRQRLRGGDALVIFTDGLSRRLKPEDVSHLGIEPAAARLLELHGYLHDDATCVLVRC